MRVAAFVYDFPHWKSTAGLFNLALHGFKPAVAFGQPKMKLKIHDSNIRISVRHAHLGHPRATADFLGIPYHVGLHNSEQTIQYVKDFKIDVGVILGARILSRDLIDAFRIGIINLHPGLIPDNRGLDNLKYAILKMVPQGVTVHLIDERVDAGQIISKEIIDVYDDDALIDIDTRLKETEQRMMILALKSLEHEDIFAPLGNATGFDEFYNETYHSTMPPDQEAEIMMRFEYYRKYYPDIRARYEETHK